MKQADKTALMQQMWLLEKQEPLLETLVALRRTEPACCCGSSSNDILEAVLIAVIEMRTPGVLAQWEDMRTVLRW